MYMRSPCHGDRKRETSGGYSSGTSGRISMKPPPNESLEFICSFGGGFMKIRPLVKVLRAPEVDHDFTENHHSHEAHQSS